jgi:hypothetical protein
MPIEAKQKTLGNQCEGFTDSWQRRPQLWGLPRPHQPTCMPSHTTGCHRAFPCQLGHAAIALPAAPIRQTLARKRGGGGRDRLRRRLRERKRRCTFHDAPPLDWPWFTAVRRRATMRRRSREGRSFGAGEGGSGRGGGTMVGQLTDLVQGSGGAWDRPRRWRPLARPACGWRPPWHARVKVSRVQVDGGGDDG